MRAVRAQRDHHPMLCGMTGQSHRLFWMRSAWWCADCRQKIECCEGGECSSVSDVMPTLQAVASIAGTSNTGASSAATRAR